VGPYAVVLGEALVDLLEDRAGEEIVYRQAIGGAPLNVAVGVTRLGGRAELLGSVGDDAFGGRIREFLRSAGVGQRGLVAASAPTTLAVTAYDGNEPDFHFYGEPPSYGLFGPDDLDPELVAGAAVLYCGSIALLADPVLAAARRAWALDGPLRAFDPNVRPHLPPGPGPVRELLESFAATADLVKLSAADARALYSAGPAEVADRLGALGAGTVVVTLGPDGALVAHGGRRAAVPGARVAAVDTTGAGDAAMAALLAGILDGGRPAGLDGWAALAEEAMLAAGLVCEARGGAAAMPTRARLRERFGDRR
jgi:fructokinase